MYDCCGMLLVMTVGQLFGAEFWLVSAEATFASTPFVTSQSNYPWRCEQFERKAANPGSAGRIAFRCDIDLMTYSGYDRCDTPHFGHIKINGQPVWEGAWCSSLKENWRGVNTMIINPVDCSAVDWRRFDTWSSVNETEEFIAYLKYLRPGALLVGVTGDEPMRRIASALRLLRAAGIKIEDVKLNGSFTFVIQIGYPEKTVFAKAINNDQPNVQLNVTIKGTTTENLKITRA